MLLKDDQDLILRAEDAHLGLFFFLLKTRSEISM